MSRGRLLLVPVQAVPANHADGFRDRWLRDVDLVVATLVARHTVPDSDLQGIGIARKKEFTHASFQTILNDTKRLREFLGKVQ
jgi:hypothetical protein